MSLKLEDFEPAVEVYEFQDFEDKEIPEGMQVEEYEIRDFNHLTLQQTEKRQPAIKMERVAARGTGFNVSPVVEHYRGLKDQEENEREERILQEISERFEAVKQQAYEEGYKAGEEKGYADSQERLNQEVDMKINELTKYIETLKAEKEELVRNERHQMYEVTKLLTKWVILRELEDDGAYLERLLEKLVLELKARSNLLIKVSRQDFERMPEVVEMVEQRLGELENTRVEVLLESTSEIQEKGMLLESENGILDGTLDSQFENITKLYETLDTYDRE